MHLNKTLVKVLKAASNPCEKEVQISLLYKYLTNEKNVLKVKLQLNDNFN